MAHFAEIDENNVVVRVLVTDNKMPNEGHDWLIENLGGTWIQTSYNTRAGVHLENKTPVRKNFAGVGFAYDTELDAFIPPKPFESWILNQETCLWESPVPYPTDGNSYLWDEQSIGWTLIQLETETVQPEVGA